MSATTTIERQLSTDELPSSEAQIGDNEPRAGDERRTATRAKRAGSRREPTSTKPSATEPTPTVSQASLGRIQRKWARVLRRAGARETALRSALVHARAIEAQLRRQSERERHAHALEVALLQERLRRLEQILLDYAASRRAYRPLDAASVPGALAAPAPAIALPALAAPQTIPFDAVAAVESMLPLLEDTGQEPADVAAALAELRAATRGPGSSRRASRPRATTPAPPTPAPRPLQLTSAEFPLAEPPLPLAQIPESPPSKARVSELRLPEPALPEPAHDFAPPESPWFPRALRRLAEEDPSSAGRLLLQLLPAQGLVWPEDLRYSLDVAETGAVAVATRDGRTSVQTLLDLDARDGEPLLRTDLAGLARALVARRGWGRIGARLSGSRGQLRPLRALASAPLGLRDLRREGVKPDPVLLLRLMANAIDPAWTAESAFTIAYHCRNRPRKRCYINVTEGAAVSVTSSPPLDRVLATLSCDAERLLDVLLGELPLTGENAQVGGERWAVARVLRWLQQVDATATASARDGVAA